MSDLLVKLYERPCPGPVLEELSRQGVTVRPARAYEKAEVTRWVIDRFGEGWAGECEVSFARQPVSCWIATRANAVEGFACYDATRRGLLGPVGVQEGARSRGLGRGLVLAVLEAMEAAGYAYAVVGAASAPEFYERVCGATIIPGSSPGIYGDRLSVFSSS